MKVFTGTDIIEVNRIQKAMQDENFKERVFTEAEVKYCEKFGDKKYEHYAARIAGKEAIFKAISPELTKKYDIGWKNIEIQRTEDGRPVVSIIADADGKLATIIEKIKEENMVIDVSLSHLESYAIATATVVVK